MLRVRVASGVNLAPDDVTVEVALKAVGANAARGVLESLPIRAVPPRPLRCRGRAVNFSFQTVASGHVTLSLNSCDGLGDCKTAGGLEALVVTGIGNLKDANGNPLYRNTSPATLVVACEKDPCRETANGVPKLPVIYTLNNTGGQLNLVAEACPAKGVVGEGQGACVDYVSTPVTKATFTCTCSLSPTPAPACSSSSGELRQRRSDDAKLLEGFARLFCKPVCVRILVLTCNEGSYSEQKSALVREVG